MTVFLILLFIFVIIMSIISIITKQSEAKQQEQNDLAERYERLTESCNRIVDTYNLIVAGWREFYDIYADLGTPEQTIAYYWETAPWSLPNLSRVDPKADGMDYAALNEKYNELRQAASKLPDYLTCSTFYFENGVAIIYGDQYFPGDIKSIRSKQNKEYESIEVVITTNLIEKPIARYSIPICDADYVEDLKATVAIFKKIKPKRARD